jgi:hypothetical protein
LHSFGHLCLQASCFSEAVSGTYKNIQILLSAFLMS